MLQGGGLQEGEGRGKDGSFHLALGYQIHDVVAKKDFKTHREIKIVY
jgi:hypothetical protein